MTILDLIHHLTAAANDLTELGHDPASAEVLLTQDSDTWGTLAALGAVITHDGKAYLIDGAEPDQRYLPEVVMEDGIVRE